jgi:outer membrane immunogenic protein
VTFAVSPRANLYVKGGYTNARLKIEEYCADNGDGFRRGRGQYLISEKTYVGAEYRYSN